MILTKKAKVITVFLSSFLAQDALYPDIKIPEKALVEKINVEPHEDELVTLERMVNLTEKQLEVYKKLKEILVDLRQYEKLFLQGEPCKLYAQYLVQLAQEGISLIRSNNLEHLFSSDFIEELATYAVIGKKTK